MNPLLTLVQEIVAAAGKTLTFQSADEFLLTLEQPGFDPLLIRSWKAEYSYFGETRHISVAHQFSNPGLQSKQLEPEICMTEHGIPIEIHLKHSVIPALVVQRSGNVVVYAKAQRTI